ncbi:hypothetical protein AMATHDRAFT_5455 [Amanita thiersii Skay4041]|uniref:Phospholipid-transporting ATPase n=1 Tax=Amanita thiersii Skay4041 TaxID=703135 RepID=A0A2A9NKM9_9AGAR|nr:hypothetical protein AMATHDRAFT_5455 [Amanita thiersii Skay4041]
MSLFKRIQSHSSETDEEHDDSIDPELRLRTVRTAASVIAESIKSEQRAERRKSIRTKSSRFFSRNTEKDRKHRPDTASSSSAAAALPTKEVPGSRRNVYVNHPPSAMEVDQHGEPIARYVRNKVRTTKYTIFTFIPKNLYEQFRRVANLFFLSLVILQLFPIFGAAAGSIAVLPLAFILAVTAVKDGIEDYRRGVLDEEVNTSAVTRLSGGWKNVNQPTDSRSWFERMFGLNKPGRVTKGVRRLRDREAGAAGVDLQSMFHHAGGGGDGGRGGPTSDAASSLDLVPRGPGGRRLEDIQSIDSHTYPPASMDASKTSLSELTAIPTPATEWANFGSLSQYHQSVHSRSSLGVVDWRKHTSGSARWERTLWKKLEVGDIVLLRDNEQVPADIVVLATSDPDGMCYLETKNLDGETNLKPRRAIKATMGISSEEDVERSSFYLDSEPPHANLYLYHGVLRYNDPATNEQKQEATTINEMLLRGCALRNTAWVIGLVVFTGADTKIMLNGGDTPSKRSKIEKETNFNVIVNFGVLSIMCLVAAIFNGLADARTGTSAEFFEEGSDPTSSHVLNAIITFASCLIAFQNIVPISLYISIEIVKTIQAFFISQDVDMYYKPFDTPCVPKTWNISDDLGQIEYIFSDKTGTLTQNVMEFQKCSVYGVSYGEGVTEAQRGAAAREGRADELDPREIEEKLTKLRNQMVAIMERTFKNKYLQKDKLTLVSPKLAEDLADQKGVQRRHVVAFFRALAICHSVLADRPDAQNEPWKLVYKAESPDEAALVAAARDAGFPFIGRTKDGIDIEVMGQPERYTPLRVLEFNSTRKRMSVIVRRPDGKVVLYCKGADSVVYARLRGDHEGWLKEQTAKDMEVFANSGLRTLCVAYRELEEDEWLSWSRVYDAAVSSLQNRDEEVDKACEMVEKDLVILGATALEDKLQEGVPEAIEMLHRAGIKLWILTGDKLQTAIEIGYSCNLLKNDMDVMILSADSMEQTRSQIEAGLNKIASVLGPPPVGSKRHHQQESERGFIVGTAKASFAVVIDGDTLRHALMPELKPLFLNLGTQCETVVCCRVSPAQKALTVKLVKEGRNAMTLSIGDGANDVAMIQEANIGCGLYGLEGSQAAMSADYAFGQFRFLTKLLLVHGRWSYQRIADMHSNFFYKNVIWTFAMFWFLPFNSFDATYLYQYTFILLYNLVFTSLPVIVLGAFDQDINAKAALAFPPLYVRGIRGLEYTRAKFWLYMSDGLYQSAVIFFIPYCVWSLGLATSWNGKGIDSLADFGTTVAVAGIFAANTYVGMNTHYWTVMTWIVVVGSSLVMLLWIVIYSFFPSIDFGDEVIILFGGIQFWATVLLTVMISLAPHFVLKYFSTVYYPLDKVIVREMWVKGDLKDQLGIRHRKSSKNKDKSLGSLEAAPMFQEQHSRSLSEISTLHHGYELAPTTTTPLVETATPRQTYLDTPPMSQKDVLRPSGVNAYTSPIQIPQDQYHAEPSIPSLSPLPSPHEISGLQRSSTPQTPVRDGGHQSHHSQASPSSMPSYYSPSDIPPSSPLPAPTYRHSSSGELGTTTPPLGKPPSRVNSIVSAPGSRRASMQLAMTIPDVLPGMPRTPPPLSAPPLGQQHGQLQMQGPPSRAPTPQQQLAMNMGNMGKRMSLGGGASSMLNVPPLGVGDGGGAYEMRVRSGGGVREAYRTPSDASFRSLGSDGYWTAEDEDEGAITARHPPPVVIGEVSAGSGSGSGGRRMSVSSDDDVGVYDGIVETPRPSRDGGGGSGDNDAGTIVGTHKESVGWRVGQAL